MPASKKSPPANKETYLAWVEFVQMYWHLLDDERRDSYLLDMADGKMPPPIQPIDELDGFEDVIIRKHLGDVLRRYRIKSGKKQKDMAEAMSKTPSYISLIESGDKMYNTFDLIRAFRYLKIPMAEMMNVDYTSNGPA